MKANRKHNFALDKALRYRYPALRYKGFVMAIEFKHNGRVWRADTVDEAVALRGRLEAEDQAALDAGEELPHAPKDQVWTPDVVTSLLTNAGVLQMRFLRTLSSGSSVPSEDIVKALKVTSEVSFAGVLSGLSKQLKKLNVKPADLYSVEVTWSGKEKTRYFRITNEFQGAATELGWPDKWT